MDERLVSITREFFLTCNNLLYTRTAYAVSVLKRCGVCPSVRPVSSARGSGKTVQRRAMRIVGCVWLAGRENFGPAVRRSNVLCSVGGETCRTCGTASATDWIIVIFYSHKNKSTPDIEVAFLNNTNKCRKSKNQLKFTHASLCLNTLKLSPFATRASNRFQTLMLRQTKAFKRQLTSQCCL